MTQLAPLTYLHHDVVRTVRNWRALIFTVALPAVLYLIFGATTPDRSAAVGEGNVAFYVLIGMAIYGATIAAAASATSVSLEQQTGWVRTLRMTPLSTIQYVVNKVAVAVAIAAVPVLALMVVGMLSGAQAPLRVWIACLALSWVGAIIFATFGLAVGSFFRTEGATQVLGGALTILGFASNVFIPLSGTMLTISQFTPMFGIITLARWPLDHGLTQDGTQIAGWVPAVNIIVWSAIFLGCAAYLHRRSAIRQ